MNPITVLTAVAVIGASILGLEGASQLGDGSFYLSSISHLAQESSQSAVTTVESAQPIQPASEQPQQPPERPFMPMDQSAPQPPPREEVERQQNFDRRSEEHPQQQEEQPPQEFIDPRQIQDGLRNMNQFRSEIKRTIKEVKRQASAGDVEELNNILAEVNKLYSAAQSSDLSAANDAVREFFDSQFWDKVNQIRARSQIPRELKQITQSVKRLEKVLATKAIQNIGLDIAKAQQTLAEMKSTAERVQTLYNSGEYQEAQEEMQFFYQGSHPGEIEGVIFRIRDIKNMAKRVKDASVKAEVDGLLQEVIDAFNAGEYRDARETLDEYADDIQRLINQVIRAQSRRGFNRNDSVSKVRNLEDLVVKKLQEQGTGQKSPVNPFAK